MGYKNTGGGLSLRCAVKNRQLLILLVGAVLCQACSASASSTKAKSPDEAALDELDVAFHEHIRSSALPRTIAGTTGQKELIENKTSGVKVLERSYADFATSEEPAVAAHALRRIGQLHLNIGCEVATLRFAKLQDAAHIGQATQLLEGQARPLLERSRDAHARAAATGTGPHADDAAAVAEALAGDFEVSTACARTAAHWESPERPDAAPVVSVAVDAKRCLEMMHMAPNPACEPVFEKTCAEGDGAGCAGLGLAHYDAGRLDAAAEAFDKACELADRCFGAVAVSAPARQAAYEAQCTEGDPLGCLKLARLLEADVAEPTFRQCSTKGSLDTKSSATQCAAGDAAACWTRAGELAQQKKVELPAVGGMMGVLGALMGGAKEETRAERMTRFRRDCDAKRPYGCIQLGEMLKEDGEDPTPVFREACDHGSEGCDRLARHLLEDGGTSQVSEAVDLLTANCADDYSGSCETAARMFANGDRVPKSPGCAAALSWRSCHPNRWWSCNQINAVFGHQ